MDALALHRFHFAFTITYHYLFPQLTMGLAMLIFILKTMAVRTGNDHYNQSTRFWIKIFGINFAMGVVTGIPMEFQFGTNWAQFSKAAGGVIGHTLAMEGMYSFFLESTFLGILLFGEQKLGQKIHWLATFMVFLGSWMSGYLIIATDAWMQHPVGYAIAENGTIHLESFWALLLNPWAIWQFLHNQFASVVTASFVMCAVGSFYFLSQRHPDFGRTFLRLGVTCGLIASVLIAFPTGDGQGKLVAKYQPVTLAAMEGLFRTQEGAPMTIVGQPNVGEGKIDNPFHIPGLLSMVTYQRWAAEVKGLDAFPKDQWPDNIPLLYYSFHIMVGLGTIFIGVMGLAGVQLIRGKLYQTKPLLWALMLMFPLPYIANTAGWMSAELGRQPWLIYGVMRTRDGASMNVSEGNTLFTLLGFMGMYTVLSMLFLLLVYRELEHGPAPAEKKELAVA